jgi:AhpD family alkylhydroperoxidase
MDNIFRKRIYNMEGFMRDFLWLRRNSPKVKTAKRFGHIDRRFSEKIKLAVTAVNECRYCMAIHADLARAEGVSEAVINGLLGKNAGDFASDFEKTAIVYAYHYAETAGNPDQGMTDGLYSFYGKDAADEIMTHIRMICFGNLSANTVDAFLSRLAGKKAPHSNGFFEFLLFLLVWPQVSIKMFAAKRRAVHAERKKCAAGSKDEARR